MKFLLFGSPIFTRLVLEQLAAANMLPAAVVCNPDRPSGRHQELTPPEVKRYILEHKLPIDILQPETVTPATFHIPHSTFDFFVVAAYSKMLSKEVLAIPRLGTIGIHSSLLPKYRGTSPIQAAMLAGDKFTGASLYVMDEKMDHGPVLSRVEVPILADDTHETLMRKIWSGAGRRLAEIIPDFLAGYITPQIQDESQATYTQKLNGQDSYVDPVELERALGGDLGQTTTIDRKIRALNPDPGVWTKTAGEFRLGQVTVPPGKRLKLLAAEVRDGKLVLKRIQIEGKNQITL
ncbi:MAG: methionyl-tRNA formyltransferase [Candidatus Liptonbacteria bacterium]|nr:methionyl-tRNA formyltransferase [Candidatus Liptonbacteria bacterium]